MEAGRSWGCRTLWAHQKHLEKTLGSWNDLLIGKGLIRLLS